MRVEQATGHESVADLLPNEVLVRIGCKGCQGAGCGEFMASQTTKDERVALTEDLALARELSGLPMSVANNVSVSSYNGEQGCGGDPGNCNGDTTGLFAEILTGTI